MARGTSTLPCARARGAPRGRSSACGVASRSASHCASEQVSVERWRYESGVRSLRAAGHAAIPAPHTRVCAAIGALGAGADATTEPRRPGGLARAHVSTGGAHRARASGTPPTPPTAAARPPPRRRRPSRASRDAPPPPRARTPRCTPAPKHVSHARVPRPPGGQRRRV